MITCPSCAHENVDGTQFCENCGEELAATTAPASAANTIKCPNCGFDNAPDNIACEACGTSLVASSTNVVASSTSAPVSSTNVVASSTAPVSPASAPADSSPFDALITSPAFDTSTPIPAPDATAIPASPDVSPSPVATAQTDDSLSATPATPLPDVAAPTMATPPVAPVATAGISSTTLAPGQLKLVVEQGQTVGAQFVLGDAELLVGREDEDEEIYPDIDLSDQDAGYVHRRHATLKFENGGLFVTHLGGANKTRVNNKPLPDNVPTPVQLGDKLGFGKVVTRVTAV